MTELKKKVQTGLDENRILVLGCQVLLGFQYRSIFEKGFDQLTRAAQLVKLGGLVSLTIALILLVTPSAYHRIVEEGEDTQRLLGFLSKLMWPALIPIVLGLGADFFVAGQKVYGTAAGLGLGAGATGVGIFFLHGLEWIQRHRRGPPTRVETMSTQPKPSDLNQKIKHVLTEARLVLPGAQALLGFQFITTLTEAFDRLPTFSKHVHMASLGCVALTVILLLTPAAYHRVVERGEDSQHVHRVASALVLAATVPLGLGISGEMYVVVRKVLGSRAQAELWAALVLLLTYGMWFGLTLGVRWHRQRAGRATGLAQSMTSVRT